MAITTYLVAKEHGKPFTALPVFPVRMAPHPAIVKNVNAGIRSPLDLNGRRVGVRAYTVTTGVWARYVLADAGVDLDSITWVVVDEEHVLEYQIPPRVESHPKASLVDMLRAGDIDAAIGIGKVNVPEIAPLFADPAGAGREFVERTGIFPINHTVVVKDDALRAKPELAHELVDLFQRAHAQAGDGADSSSIGLEANRRTIETLMNFAQQQGLIARPHALDAIFAG
jgi:4,5-dihydroxyphthalate decarboxylase